MSIAIPSSPGFRAGKPRLLDFGATLTPPMGGPAQRLNRTGNRFALDVQLATSRSYQAGRVAVSRLLQALTEGGVYAFPQDLFTGAPGAPIVDGGGQSGSSLKLRAFAANYTVLEGQFFSIVYDNRRYLHVATADVTADINGQMSLPIVPMLRIVPNDAAVCEFARPMIEGFLSGNALEWQLQSAPYLDVSFTITEAA